MGRGDLYTIQPYTTYTHGGEEGRRNTPTSWCHSLHTSSPSLKNKSTPAKR